MSAEWSETFLWSALWQSSAWLAAGLAASALLHRQPARAHGALLVAIGGAIVTPLLAGLFRLAGWGLLPGTSRFVGLADLQAQLTGEDGVPVTAIGLSWAHALVATWLVATAVAATRLGISAWRGRRLLEDARPVHDATLQEIARRAADRLGLRSTPLIYESDAVRCPVVWCWGGRPRLVMPTGCPRSELFGVLCHELAHFKRRDHLASFAAEAAICVLPWNPLAWIAVRRLHELSEQCCDTWVLAVGESPTSYAEALLEMVPQKPLVLTPAAVNGRQAVTRRIRRILDVRPGEPRSGRRWMLALATSAVVLATSTALAHRRPATIAVVHENGDSAPLVGPDVISIPPELDLGVAPPGAARTRTVTLCNRSERTRAVFSAATSCGCTTVSEFEPTTLSPGECLEVDVTMTAPTELGLLKTKYVTFKIEGQDPLKLPVHLFSAAAP